MSKQPKSLRDEVADIKIKVLGQPGLFTTTPSRAADSESESKPEFVGVGSFVRSRSRFFDVGESAKSASTPQPDCGDGVKPGVGVG